MKPTDTSVKSATRTLDVIEFIAAAKAAPTFGDVAVALQIPNSSLFYLLSTLCKRGYLLLDETPGRYSLGPAVGGLVSRAQKTQPWHQLALPLLHRVTSQLNETSTYAEQRGDEIECVGVVLANQALLPVLRIGQRSALYCFSGGKLLLANMADADIDAYLERVKFQKFTPHTITDRQSLWGQVNGIRQTGVAYSREEHTLGVIGMSVALKTRLRVVGVVGVAVATARFNERLDRDIRVQLASAAELFLTTSADALPESSVPRIVATHVSRAEAP